MKAIVPVSLPDLMDAFEWVSASTTLENLAYVSRSTGKTYITSREMDVGDELPDDIDDGREYLAVPHKNELNLGSYLAISFCRKLTSRISRCGPCILSTAWRLWSI